MKHEPIKPRARTAPGSRLESRTARREVELSAHVLRGTGQIVDVSLIDLSYEGCRVRTSEYLWQGEAIKLSVPRRGVINARARWCAEGHAGLSFDPEIKKPTKARVERSSIRVKTTCEVTLRRIGHVSFRVDVRDMPPDGCRIDLVERPAIGETLHIKFDGLEVLQCKLRWIEGYVAGVEFVNPIHPAVFRLLVHRLRRR